MNAALAHAPNLASFSTVEDFEPLAPTLASSLAWRGAFAFGWKRLLSGVGYFVVAAWKMIPTILWARALIAICLLSIAAGLRDALKDNTLFDGLLSVLVSLDWGSVLASVDWRLIGSIAVALLVAVLLLSRGVWQEAIYASIIESVASNCGGGRRRLYVRDWGQTSDGDGLGIMHVLVTTDLLSGEPMYFSKQFVYCKPYGWSTSGNIRTAEALYSSALSRGVSA